EGAAAVHVGERGDEVGGVVVARAVGPLGLDVAEVVAADGEDVADAEVVELDQRVLGLLAREPAAEDVGHGVDAVAVLEGGTEADGAGPLPLDVAADRAVGELLVVRLGRVARHVDERRLEREQRLDDGEDLLDGAAAAGRDDLVGDERARGALVVLGDFHSPWSVVRCPWSCGPNYGPRTTDDGHLPNSAAARGPRRAGGRRGPPPPSPPP